VAEYRAQAAASFRNEDFSTETRARLLEAARRDDDANMRGRAWEALSPFAKDKEIRRDMMAVAETEDAPLPERGGALVALADYADELAVHAAIDDLYAQPEGRAKALEAMWRSLDRRFAARFPEHLADPDIEIKRQAIWGVGYLAIHAEAGRLREFFKDEDLRADALFAYALAVPGETTRGRVRALFRKIEEDAGTLSEEETALVRMALDERLTLGGLKPVFYGSDTGPAPEAEPKPAAQKVGRNDPCPCGSGKKYKKCCGNAA
ncbi:MAG: SEC-C metal-binding domain-containing protein, partial [Bryobacteraceae bacterium]